MFPWIRNQEKDPPCPKSSGRGMKEGSTDSAAHLPKSDMQDSNCGSSPISL